ncbi:glutamate--cysteine ligase [Serratia symbiotica str. 'Cinara cedri']|nr:glutamate--cysteine ligase [Serratia symbiotica str. 'Cinara cedri']
MITDVYRALSWLEAHPQALKGIRRGIERETLRVTPNGTLALTRHPKNLGASLTHHWITTDFAEALLEFITPVDDNLDHLLTFLRDMHRHVARNLGEERMWPFSMPCIIDVNQDIELAQFGSSNIGRMKTIYREGLKNRYGALMHTISGVHYNFSLPLAFWQEFAGVKDAQSGKVQISAVYFSLIRNYYRFGWVIPYLFGASPVICSSFLKKHKNNLMFECLAEGMYYLPYATSLRLSDFGYTNKLQNNFDITFNNLHGYVTSLKRAMVTPSDIFAKLGVKNGDNYLQLNSNILQIENELYTLARPKCIAKRNETLSDALLRGGVEYIEVRSLDINPFSPIGIDAVQVRFLDLFLIWCVLADAPEIDNTERLCIHKNWNRVILEGRKPGQTIDIGRDGIHEPLEKIGKALFKDLRRVAKVLDGESNDRKYQQVCNKLISAFYNPELTFSARILKIIMAESPNSVGLRLAEQYHRMLIEEPLEIISEVDLIQEENASWQRQRDIENSDSLSFEAFMEKHNNS